MKLECKQRLPDAYSKKCVIDLQQDTKTAAKVAMVNILLFAAVLAIGLVSVPIRYFIGNWNEKGGFLYFLLRVVALTFGYLAYIPLHELTHAVMMKCLGAKEIQFNISKQFACAGSKNSYFSKIAHRRIAVVPFLLWTPVLAVIAFSVPQEWFWVVWLIEANNVSGCIGDLYVIWYISKMSDTVLINDTGFTMTVFDIQNEQNIITL